MNAKVIGWTDGGNAELFEDEHGGEWKYAVDAMDGTIAVERTDGSKAGIFSWDIAGATGTINECEDGATYGVNSTEDHIVENGEWVDNEEES